MEIVLVEKLIELIRRIFTTEIDDEMIYLIDECKYEDDYYDLY